MKGLYMCTWGDVCKAIDDIWQRNEEKMMDINKTLEQHRLWSQSGGKQGTKADLSGANLSWTDLSGANLSEANLSRVNLSMADLSGANLFGANLTGANLSGADLSRANLSGANLSRADLSNANLFKVYLSNANLSGADLSETDLSNANLSEANLSNANLSMADLSGANLLYIKGKNIYSFSSSQHFAYCCDGNITIGCITKSIAEWIEQYEQIGKDNDYSDTEIKSYGNWIKMMK